MIKLILLCSTVFLLIATSAMADQIFDFTYSGDYMSGSGVLDAISNGDNSYTAVSGTSTLNLSDSVIFSLFLNPNGTSFSYSQSGYFIYDNQLYPATDPLINNNGLLFTSGSTELNIFSNGPSKYQAYLNNGKNDATVQFTLTAVDHSNSVPEPSTFLLFGAGIAGVAFFRKRMKA